MPPRTLPPCRILVVDDQVSVTYVLAKLFEQSGHTVRVAHDAIQAAEIAFQFQPDIAIIDLWMPLVDGLALGRAIRSADMTHRVGLVAFTGIGRDGARQASLDAGFDLFIEKPADLAELEGILVSSLFSSNFAARG